MPMSRKRCRAAAESVAWREDRTKWPVSADCTAIRAVSTSRISPTRMTSGSWRRIDRSPLAKVIPACSLVWIWLIEGNTYSTGSSIVMMLRLGSSISVSAAYSVVVLPLPVGPGAQHHAERRPDEPGEHLVGVGGHAEVAHPEQRPALVEHPQHAALAPDRGHRRDPDVDLAAVDGHRDLAVLGAAALDDVHVGHDLEAAHEGRRHRRRELDGVVERAVDAEADPQLLVLGLDVDVGGPVAQGLGDEQVHDLHDGRVVGDDRLDRRVRCGRCGPRVSSKARTCSSMFPRAR